jgi:Cu2+-exporting ATPase
MAATPAAAGARLDDPAELAGWTRWDGARLAESSLRIGGMHCAACAGIVEAALSAQPGVREARVSAAAQAATVRWDPGLTRASVLVHAVEAAGYSATPDTAGAARAARAAEARTLLWRLFVAWFCAMQVMMLATPAYVSAPGELAADQKRLLDWGGWLLTLPVLCFAAAPFFAGAWRALRSGRIGMDVPVALGIAVAFVASSGAAYDPGGAFGAEVWFDSLAMFVAFLLSGRWLEMRARHRAEAALESSALQLPDAVQRVLPDGGIESVSARRLVPGDTVRVPVGQVVPADGVLLQGRTEVDEALLSGESRPVAKPAGALLVAGSINLGAPVEMRVERVGADTRQEAILALMRSARTQRPALLASADRWAAPFLWIVLLLAFGAGAVWSVLDPARAAWVVVAVLIVTCPCALSLAAPSAYLAAAGALGRRGLLLRRLDAIEGLARLQRLFVDKTGTLTDSRLVCLEVRAPGADAAERERLAAVAAALASWSSHPVAAAIAAARAPAGGAWRDVRELPGRGLEGIDADGRRWRLGAAGWAGAAPHGADTGADTGAAQAWLGCDGVCRAVFVCGERLRDGTAAAIAALQRDGIAVELLSGDTPAQVERIAAAAGLDRRAGALGPEDKLAAVAAAQARGEVVAMLGDGINDAPVLARADVSIAMGGGALVARTQADGVLVSERLGDLVQACALARRTLRVVRQNLGWAALYNAACVPLALAGWLPPWAAGLGMASSSLLVVLNSLRLAR